jgi:hypothetical protein
MYWQLSRPNKKSGNLGYSLPSLFLGLFLRKRKPIRQWSMKHLGNKPVPLKLVGKPPQFGIDRLDLLHVLPGPPSVLGVRRYRACFAFRGSRSIAPAAVQSAPVPALERSLLAERAPTCLGEASTAWPVDPKTRFVARFDKIFVVSFCHCSFRPFMRLGVRSSLLVAV